MGLAGVPPSLQHQPPKELDLWGRSWREQDEYSSWGSHKQGGNRVREQRSDPWKPSLCKVSQGPQGPCSLPSFNKSSAIPRQLILSWSTLWPTEHCPGMGSIVRWALICAECWLHKVCSVCPCVASSWGHLGTESA